MVRRAVEPRRLVAYGVARIVILDDTRVNDVIVQILRTVDEVDTRLAVCRGVELSRITVAYDINIWRIVQDVVMHHKTRVVVIVSVEPVVLRRTRVEVTHHHPITALRLRRRKYRVSMQQ